MIEIYAFHLIVVHVFLVLGLLKAFVFVIISLHFYGISSEYEQMIGYEMLTCPLIVTAGG